MKILDPFKEILEMRYQGGPNAGHTITNGLVEIASHQVPSGIIHGRVHGLSGSGVFIDPVKYVKEIMNIVSLGIPVSPHNLSISSKAHLILNTHTIDDKANYDLENWTSTGSGIMQCETDKSARRGIRIVDALDKNHLREVMKYNFEQKYGSINKKLFDRTFNIAYHSVQVLKEFIKLEEDIINDPKYQFLVEEGAQGVMLDETKGQYRGTTGSEPYNPPYRPDTTIGVLKLYQSSVGTGNRPFVGKMDFNEDIVDKIRVKWGEFGTTTGKPREIGWFDLVAAKYAIATTQIDEIVGTCLDKLEVLHEMNLPLKVVVGYKIGNKVYDKWDIEFDIQLRLDSKTKTYPNGSKRLGVKPVYKEFATWDKTLDEHGNLTPNAKAYVQFLEENLEKEFAQLGVGPDSKDIIEKKKLVQLVSQ